MADEKQMGALLRRHEQLKRWQDSETNRVSAFPREDSLKVKFQDGCIFLAACSSSDTQEVKKLLDRGADINTANVDGLTALHQACIDDNQDMVEFLVENKSDVDVCDNEGWTPLHATASCGFTEIARYLLKHGANVAAVNNDGDLPIDICEEDEMENLLQKEMNDQGIDADAARSEEEERMLADANQWLNSKIVKEKKHSKTGATALHVAAAKGYMKVMEILLQAGVDINAKDVDGWTPLHAAAHWGQEESCQQLVDNLCDMDAKNNAGQTSFELADTEMIRVLEDLKKKQLALRDKAPLQDEIISTRGLGQKRRSSVTRMSGDQKANVILKASEEERASLFKGGDKEIRTQSDEDDHETERQNEINKKTSTSLPSSVEERQSHIKPEMPKIDEDKEMTTKPADANLNGNNTTSLNNEVIQPSAEVIKLPDNTSDVAPPPSSTPTVVISEPTPTSTSTPAPESRELTRSISAPSSSNTSDLENKYRKSRSYSEFKKSYDKGISRYTPSVSNTNLTITVTPLKPTWRSSNTRPTCSSLSNTRPISVYSSQSNSRNDNLRSKSTSDMESSERSVIKRPNSTSLSQDDDGKTDRQQEQSQQRDKSREADPSSVTSVSSPSRSLPTVTIATTSTTAPVSTVSTTTTVTTATTTPMSSVVVKTPTSTVLKGFKTYELPKRDEEAETQRRARAKRARETRRSTQGVSLEDLEKAEDSLKSTDDKKPVERKNSQDQTDAISRVSGNITSKPEESVSTPSTRRRAWDDKKEEEPVSRSSIRRSRDPSLRDGVNNTYSTDYSPYIPRSQRNALSAADINNTSSLEGSTGTSLSRTTSLRSRLRNGDVESKDETTEESRKDKSSSERDTPDGEKKEMSSIRARRARRERRSTGIVNYSPENEEGEKEKENKPEEEKKDQDEEILDKLAGLRRSLQKYDNLGSRSYGSGSTGSSYDSGRYSSTRPSSYNEYSSRSTTNIDSDYKKLYEDEKSSNEKLKKELEQCKQELREAKKELDRVMRKHNDRNDLTDKREKRALERKLSEMEEELKKMDNLKADNARLKEENGALIRVISKLSK